MDDLPARGPPFDPAVPGPPELLPFSTSYTVKRKARMREAQMTPFLLFEREAAYLNCHVSEGERIPMSAEQS